MKKNKIALFIIVMIFFSKLLLAENSVIEETGYGKKIKIAKENALKNLSENIEVKVKVSKITTSLEKEGKYSSNYVSKSSITSNKKLYGIKYTKPLKTNEGYEIKVYFDLESLKIFKSTLLEKQKKILTEEKELNKDTNLDKKKKELIEFQNVLRLYLEEEKLYEIVNERLGNKNQFPLINQKKIKVMINGETYITSLNLTAIDVLIDKIIKINKGITLSLEESNLTNKYSFLKRYPYYIKDLFDDEIEVGEKKNSNLRIQIIEKENHDKVKNNQTIIVRIIESKTGSNILKESFTVLKEEKQEKELEILKSLQYGFVKDRVVEAIKNQLKKNKGAKK